MLQLPDCVCVYAMIEHSGSNYATDSGSNFTTDPVQAVPRSSANGATVPVQTVPRSGSNGARVPVQTVQVLSVQAVPG